MCKFHGPHNVLSTRNAELACTTTVWSMLGRKRSARVKPMARVGSRQAMYRLICLYQVIDPTLNETFHLTQEHKRKLFQLQVIHPTHMSAVLFQLQSNIDKKIRGRILPYCQRGLPSNRAIFFRCHGKEGPRFGATTRISY